MLRGSVLDRFGCGVGFGLASCPAAVCIGVSPVKEKSRAAASKASISAAAGRMPHPTSSSDSATSGFRHSTGLLGSILDRRARAVRRARRRSEPSRASARARGSAPDAATGVATAGLGDGGLLGGPTDTATAAALRRRSAAAAASAVTTTVRGATSAEGVIGASCGSSARCAASGFDGWRLRGDPRRQSAVRRPSRAFRRRRSAREAPVVSAVAESGVAEDRLERRVGADAAGGASKGKAQGAFGSCRSGGNGRTSGSVITFAVRAAKVTIG